MAFSTNLAGVTGWDASEYSTRALTQSLKPISAATVQRRTVNGTLVDVAATQFRKYASTISCADQLPPALDGVYPGMQITIDCVSELSYVTDGGSPARTVVPGSSRVEGLFTFYRPRITFMIVEFEKQTDEWGATVTWSIELEEV